MLYFSYFIIYLIVFLFGISIGSFLNVLIYRIPKSIPFWKGRSFCVSCDTTIKAYDLIPIISFLFLRGRCRNCNIRISRRYPLVELIAGLIALLIYWIYGFSYFALIYFAFSAILVTIAFIDYDTMTIPNGLVLILIIPVIATSLLTTQPDILSRIIGFFALSLPMFLLTLVISDCFGGGDIKLIAVCGFMLGWQNAIVAAFIALILGGSYGALLLIRDKNNRNKHFAFGQYICISVFISLLYGDIIINSYLHIFDLI